jgi:dihydrofolate reductase
MADAMNNTPKLVASTTLEEATWQNSTLIKGDLATELKRHKERDGKNINISGSAKLIRSLLRDGLPDELRLLVFPVVVGSGARLFEGYEGQLSLALSESRTFDTGVVSLGVPAGRRVSSTSIAVSVIRGPPRRSSGRSARVRSARSLRRR